MYNIEFDEKDARAVYQHLKLHGYSIDFLIFLKYRKIDAAISYNDCRLINVSKQLLRGLSHINLDIRK